MDAPPTFHKAGIIILLLLFGFNSSLYAQSDSNSEEVQKYEELVRYRANHVIEQEEEAKSFSETMTGIGTQAPDDVFLAELVVSDDPDKLKKAEIPQAIADIPVGDFEFVEYDNLFADDSGDGLGLTVGTKTGRCPPGSGGFNF